jgi:glycosyltransferase involved in cell wall biosynthesis
MHVCFISSEVFVGMRRGGFGRLVRIIGSELVKRGYTVSVLTWREKNLQDFPSKVDGINAWAYNYDYTTRSVIKNLPNYRKAISMIKRINADVYISIDCILETLLAMKYSPCSKHIIYVQDPFDEKDYRLLSTVDPYYNLTFIDRLRFMAARVGCSPSSIAYRKADLVLTQAKYYIPKIKKLFGVDERKIFYLPNPVDYIPNNVKKNERPLVVFIGRFDPQKRFWIVPRVAKRFPDIDFVMAGMSSDLYREWSTKLLAKLRVGEIENLEILGFVNEERKREVLSKSWILLLPSIREGLPLAFLESLAHRCALLSSVNPDGLVTRFGYYASRDEFENGLKELLADEKWRSLGESGYRYIIQNHSLNDIMRKFTGLIESLS